jgi:hypothetical protein
MTNWNRFRRVVRLAVGIGEERRNLILAFQSASLVGVLDVHAMMVDFSDDYQSSVNILVFPASCNGCISASLNAKGIGSGLAGYVRLACWVQLQHGSATFDRRIKADGTTAAVLVWVRRVGWPLSRRRDAPALATLGQ